MQLKKLIAHLNTTELPYLVKESKCGRFINIKTVDFDFDFYKNGRLISINNR